jgi:hypothetical protein
MRSAAQLTSPLPQGGWKPAGTLAHAGDPRSAPADDRVMVTPGPAALEVATLVMTQRPAPAARRLAIPTGDAMATQVAPAMACVA